MDYIVPMRVLLGFAFACWLGHYVTARCVDKLWKPVANHKDLRDEAHNSIRFWHGVAERAFYAAAVWLGKPEGIAVWLGFKAVMRWKTEGNKENDTRHIAGGLIFQTGTVLSVAFGVLGGMIAAWKFSL